MVIRRLIDMAAWAKERRTFFLQPPGWWCDEYYIRVGGNGFTAVSVDDDRPLMGYGSGAVKDLATLEKYFRSPHPKYLEKLHFPKPERKIQSWLIKMALKNEKQKFDLLEPLGLADNGVYEKLFFAFDEVSIGDNNHDGKINRTDIMAVGVHEGVAYPVLIELKFGRMLTGEHNLITQLNRYAHELRLYDKYFKQLLDSCLDTDVSMSRVGKIMVWPRSRSGRVSNDVDIQCSSHQVTLIESASPDFEPPFNTARNHLYPPLVV